MAWQHAYRLWQAVIDVAVTEEVSHLAWIELTEPAVKLRGWKLGLALTTAALSAATNMAIGFVAGLIVFYIFKPKEGGDQHG